MSWTCKECGRNGLFQTRNPELCAGANAWRGCCNCALERGWQKYDSAACDQCKSRKGTTAAPPAAAASAQGRAPQGSRAAQPQAQASKEQECLRQLAAMGFTDASECTRLLRKFHGDLTKVTDSLLASQPGASSDKDKRLAQQVVRMGDVTGDHGMLSPVTGVMKAPQLSLVEAAVRTGVADIDAMAYMAAERGAVLARDDPHGLTSNEAGALTLYTMEGDLYPSMNRLLRERNRTVLIPYFPYMRLLLAARRKLPVFRGNVWRGVAGICLSVCLSVFLCVCLSLSLSVHRYIRTHIHTRIHT